MADVQQPGRYTWTGGGYIQFPHPFMVRHMRVWWETAVSAVAEKTRVDWTVTEAEWSAARTLILDYGQWAIDGISVGDVRDDNLPAALLTFVVEKADEYITPFLPSAMRRIQRIRS